MQNDETQKRAEEMTQHGLRGAELVTRIIQFSATSEPTLPMAILGNAAMAAAVGLWREGGMTEAQIAQVLRDLAKGYESGAFTPEEDDV
jgi:hypothetical protein